ncbi:MAG: winged helix-turn-helix domain-containing protein [Nitrososphaeria archaeon]
MDELFTIFGSKGKIKILKTLLEEEEINISALLKKTQIAHPLATRYLCELEKGGLIRQKKFGKIKIVSLVDNKPTRMLRRFLKEWEDSKEEDLGKGYG